MKIDNVKSKYNEARKCEIKIDRTKLGHITRFKYW